MYLAPGAGNTASSGGRWIRPYEALFEEGSGSGLNDDSQDETGRPAEDAARKN